MFYPQGNMSVERSISMKINSGHIFVQKMYTHSQNCVLY